MTFEAFPMQPHFFDPREVGHSHTKKLPERFQTYIFCLKLSKSRCAKCVQVDVDVFYNVTAPQWMVSLEP